MLDLFTVVLNLSIPLLTFLPVGNVRRLHNASTVIAAIVHVTLPLSTSRLLPFNRDALFASVKAWTNEASGSQVGR